MVDVPLFVILHTAGLSVLFANIISTTAALIVSLILNYRFTFKSRSITKLRIALYFAVTLVGIWILQPLVINGLLLLNDNLHVTAPLIAVFGHAKQLDSLIAKLLSLAVSLVWNYTWYSKVVFKEPPVTSAQP